MKPKTIRTIPQERTPMPEQTAAERSCNFSAVALGYTLENARNESDRCLMCDDPKCVAGCPVQVNIPAFIRKICEGDYRGAYDVLSGDNLLPAICGRVCPQENQCEGVCTVGGSLEPVAVGRLERWVGDMAIENGWANIPDIEPSGFRVGIIGSGPAGLACAADLARAGCEVVIFEALHAPGGVLRYGIPEFRLPNSVVDAEISMLKDLGVKMECNTLVGRLFTIEQMIDEMGFHAVFVGAGAGAPRFMGIPGESLGGVMSANELLTRCNLMNAGKFPEFDTPLNLGRHVVVIGAGNTAMDAMRVSLRLGAAKVSCVYRRSESECPARLEELHHAQEEGVEFHWLTAPVEILGDEHGNVRGLRNIRMELGEPDASGRRSPVPVEGSEYDFEADMVVFAIGTKANPIIGQTSNIRLNKWGYIATDENLATSLAGVFAGGDIVTGAATVIQAMGAGRKAARGIKAYLGIVDTDSVYDPAPAPGDRVFGLGPEQKKLVRVRLDAARQEASYGTE
jgi:glutamate synthase (NADPH/NADH) small chain